MNHIELFTPSLQGEFSFEEVIMKRRSNRTFTDRPVELVSISQLLWAAQGIRNNEGARMAPSAGGR